MGDIQKRLDNVRQMIQSQDFLEGKGLSNEVNIRIFCYEPRDEMAVRHFIEQLSTDMTLGCQLRICNLYQIFLGICEGMDILDAIPDMEEEDGHSGRGHPQSENPVSRRTHHRIGHPVQTCALGTDTRYAVQRHHHSTDHPLH